MATDSVMGLFASPEQIQQQQYQQAFDRNMQLARLNPRDRNVAMFGTSVDRLGSAVGGALGGQDPQLARATQRRAFIQQVNMADPQSLAQAIQASANDPELSTFLLGKYKELTGIQKDQSVIEKNKNWEKAKDDDQQNYDYCTKDGKFKTNMKMRKPCKDPMDGKEFKDWQNDIINIITGPVDDRKIYWFWEDTGGIGKSTFCKHCCQT